MSTLSPERKASFRRIRKLLPLAVAFLVVGSLVAVLYPAVQRARNAARAANTT